MDDEEVHKAETSPRGSGALGKIVTAVIILLFLVVLSISGYMYYSLYTAQKDEEVDPMRPVEGFEPGAELNFPRLSPMDPSDLDPIPMATADRAPGYSYNLQWVFLNNTIYQDIGSVVEIALENTGTNSLFVIEYGIEPEWSGQRHYEATGKLVEPGEARSLGMAAFPGPAAAKEYEYNIGVTLMAQDRDGDWYDYDWSAKTVKTVMAASVGQPAEYKLYLNPEYYYDRVIPLFEDDSLATSMAGEIVSDFGTSYNIYSVCALFDYVVDNIEYVCDPEGEDSWATPDETLFAQNGDCEDMAVLAASFIRALGGDVRIHFTPDHAYASFFAGNDQSLDSLSRAISKYYGITRTGLSITSYSDDFGNWIIIDPTVGFHPGAPPLGTMPVDAPEGYRWDFTEVEYVMFMDITGV